MAAPTPKKVVNATANVQRNHPNATLAGGAGAFGTIIVWFSTDIISVPMDATTGATFATVFSAGALFIGRQGLKGALRTIWEGKRSEEGGND